MSEEMSKYKSFPRGEEPSTSNQVCDGLLRHKWAVITADKGIGTDISGLCWCRYCGAWGRWNNSRPNHGECVTEITLTEESPYEF